MLDGRIEQSKRQKRGRQLARDGHPETLDRRWTILPGDDNGTIAIAHARSVRQQNVAVGQVRVSVERHSRDLVLALACRAIERLDVGQNMLEYEAIRGHATAR